VLDWPVTDIHRLSVRTDPFGVLIVSQPISALLPPSPQENRTWPLGPVPLKVAGVVDPAISAMTWLNPSPSDHELAWARPEADVVRPPAPGTRVAPLLADNGDQVIPTPATGLPKASVTRTWGASLTGPVGSPVP
jgi:hypothetical protein